MTKGQQIKTPTNVTDFFSRHESAFSVQLTKTGGSLATEVHSIQAHSALGSSHVEPNCEAVSGVVMHHPLSLPLPVSLTVLQTATVLWTQSE